MFLKHIDLTTALRPSYLPDEVLLFVQDNVGLYEGYVTLIALAIQQAENKKLTKRVTGNTKSQTIKMDKFT
jgi:hypothetical protein